MRPMREYRFVSESEMSMPVSVIVPANNEEATILDVVYSLLHTQFNRLEVVVIHDGSLDRTLALLKDEFELVAVERVPSSGIPTQPVYQVYASALDARLCVIDRRNGGKADALNVGINHAQYPLVCAIDADTVLDPGALARLVWEFQSDPDTVATGGIVGIANGSTVQKGRVVSISTRHRQFLANVQILEYLRAFLTLAWANGYFITMAVILIEERAFRRYPNWQNLPRMAVVALVENIGYRQWQDFVRLRAIFRLRSQRGVWGEMQRSGFSAAAKASD